jgi:hypothetical protein
VFADEQLDL